MTSRAPIVPKAFLGEDGLPLAGGTVVHLVPVGGGSNATVYTAATGGSSSTGPTLNAAGNLAQTDGSPYWTAPAAYIGTPQIVSGVPIGVVAALPVTSAADAGADVAGAATGAVASHVSASDPHGDRAAAASALASHTALRNAHLTRVADLSDVTGGGVPGQALVKTISGWAPGTISADVPPGPFSTTSGVYDSTSRQFGVTYTNGPNRRLVVVRYNGHFSPGGSGATSGVTKADTVIAGVHYPALVVDTLSATDASNEARLIMFAVDPGVTYSLFADVTVAGQTVISWDELDTPAEIGVSGSGISQLGEIAASPTGQTVTLLRGAGQAWQELHFDFTAADTPDFGQGFTGELLRGLALVDAGGDSVGGGFYALSIRGEANTYPWIGFNGPSIEWSGGSGPPDSGIERLAGPGGLLFSVLPNRSDQRWSRGHVPGVALFHINSAAGVAADYPNGLDYSIVNTWNEFYSGALTAALIPTSGFQPGGLLDLCNVGFKDPYNSGAGAGYASGAAPITLRNRGGDKITLWADELPNRVGLGLGITTASTGSSAILASAWRPTLFAPLGSPLVLAQTPAQGQGSAGTAGLQLFNDGTIRLTPTPALPAPDANYADLYVDPAGNLVYRDRTGIVHTLIVEGSIDGTPPIPPAHAGSALPHTLLLTGGVAGPATRFSDGSGTGVADDDYLRTQDGTNSAIELPVANAQVSATFDAIAVPVGATIQSATLTLVERVPAQSGGFGRVTAATRDPGLPAGFSEEHAFSQTGFNFAVSAVTIPPATITQASLAAGLVTAALSRSAADSNYEITYMRLDVTWR